MAVPPHLQYTILGEGPITVEIYLSPICPNSKRALRNLADSVIPELVKGGKYYGKGKLIFRLAPYPWHPQGCFVSEHALAFGKEFCSQPVNSILFFNCLRELTERQREFFDHKVQDESANSIKERLNIIIGEIVERAGVASKEEGVQRVRALTQLNNFRFGGTVLIGDSKYYSRLTRQNGVWAVPTVLVNGLEDCNVTSKWTPKEWTTWFEVQLAQVPFNPTPVLPPESPPIEWKRLPMV